MRNICKFLLAFILFSSFQHALPVLSAKELLEGIPSELKGFKGMMVGKLVEKREKALVFRVDSIKKTWKGNKAENPKKAIGKTILLNLEKVSGHHNNRIIKNFKTLKNGDQIELEAFDMGQKTLGIKEWLKKTEAK